MNQISAIIIAKNEDQVISDCFSSVSFCDELILIDGGSTDKTIQIAKEKGVKVYEKIGDFSQMRNFGLEKAKGEWIFYIDADERVNENLKKAIQSVIKENNNKFAAYSVSRKNFYLGKHEWPQIEHMQRLFQKKQLKKWYGALHESPQIDGEVGELSGFLLHYTHRNISYMLSKTIQWSSFEAKLRYDAHHPKISWWRFPRVMIPTFYDFYIRQKGYRVGIVGLVESTYQAFSIFITYAKLWEMQKEHE
jgi:glycosyltransferase involved in cell wall biosynthesis